MNLQRDLERLGLGEKEATIYLAALKLGRAPAREIASQAGISRPAAFIVLESLVKQGLVTAVQEGERTIYSSEHPRQLERLLQKEEARLKEQEAVLNDIGPQLTSLWHLTDHHPIVKVYTGPDALAAMDKDGMRHRKKGRLSYSFTALDKLEKAKKENIGDYADHRLQLQEPLRVIYTHRDGPQPYVNDPKVLREARFMPRKKFPFESSIVIRPWFGLRIFIHRPDEFIGVSIESQELARTMQAIFELCWQSLSKK